MNKTKILWTESDEVLLKQMYKNGVTQKELAKYFNIHISSIKRKLWGMGLKKYSNVSIDDKKEKQILQLFKDTKSVKQVSEIIGADGETIRRYLKKNGYIVIGQTWLLRKNMSV